MVWEWKGNGFVVSFFHSRLPKPQIRLSMSIRWGGKILLSKHLNTIWYSGKSRPHWQSNLNSKSMRMRRYTGEIKTSACDKRGISVHCVVKLIRVVLLKFINYFFLLQFINYLEAWRTRDRLLCYYSVLFFFCILLLCLAWGVLFLLYIYYLLFMGIHRFKTRKNK